MRDQDDQIEEVCRTVWAAMLLFGFVFASIVLAAVLIGWFVALVWVCVVVIRWVL